MRTLAWMGTWALVASGCRYVVSFAGLSNGSNSSETTFPDGGDAAPSDVADAAVDAADVLEQGPVLVRSSLQTLRGIAVHGDHVYWVEGTPAASGMPGNWAVYKVLKRNAAGLADEVGTGQNVFDVAANETHAYWSDGAYIRLVALSDASAPSGHLEIGASTARYLSVDTAGRAYVTTDNQIFVGPCASPFMCKSTDPVTGTGAYGPFPALSGASGVALDANFLFWGHHMPPAVTRASRATLDPASNLEMPSAERVSGVATDGIEVYWIAGDRAIVATPVTGPPAPRTVCDGFGADGGFGPDADLAVDDEWVYFTRPSAKLIQKCRKKSGS